MTGPSCLVDNKRIAKKIKSASEGADPRNVKWIGNPTRACPMCNYVIDNSDVVHKWPGLPHGVKFDPSDQELLQHLMAKVGKTGLDSHPFISEFIPTVEEDDGICYTQPLKIPGVKQDGSVLHFFHRTFKAHNTGTRKRRKINTDDQGDVCWHKTGKTKPVLLDGEHMGCKKIMVLYISAAKGGKAEKTNWVMHQYYLGTGEDEKDGEFVVSKIFYQKQLKPCERSRVEPMFDTAEAVDAEILTVACSGSATPEYQNQHMIQSSEETSDQMTPSGRGRPFQGRSEPDAEEHASDTMEDETVDVTHPAAPGLRTMLHVTGGDRLSDPHATRKAVELLKLKWTEPWESWRDVPGDVRDFLWDQFMGLYTCPDDERALLRRTWEAALQRRMTGILSRARTVAERASGTKDRSSWALHRPGWMQARVWEELLRWWGTAEWAARSEAARRNRLTEEHGGVTKHTGGFIPFSTHRERMERSMGKAPSQLDVFRGTHTKKGTEGFIDERSRKFMEDYSAAAAQSGGSSSNPVDVDAAAWMQAAADFGRGQVYGYTPGESPGLLSTAPNRSHARCASESSSAQGGGTNDLVTKITDRVCERFESRFTEIFTLMRTLAPSSSHPPGKGGSGEDID